MQTNWDQDDSNNQMHSLSNKTQKRIKNNVPLIKIIKRSYGIQKFCFKRESNKKEKNPGQYNLL